jgi:hypothetical protein
MYKEGIADKKEVMERTLKSLQDKHGIYLNKEILNEVYESTVSYIRKRKKEIPFCSIKLGDNLGRAYWPQSECKIRKNYISPHSYTTKRSEELGEIQRQLWEERYALIEEDYQNNQPRVNVSKMHRNYHVIIPLIKGMSRRKILMEEVEEIQNKI